MIGFASLNLQKLAEVWPDRVIDRGSIAQGSIGK
jgi:hypothetical protein